MAANEQGLPSVWEFEKQNFKYRMNDDNRTNVKKRT